MSLIESDQLREQIANLRDNYYLISNPLFLPLLLNFLKKPSCKKSFLKFGCFFLSAGNLKTPDTDWFPNLQRKI